MNDAEKYKRIQSSIERAKADIAEASFAIKKIKEKLQEYGANNIEEAEKILDDLISESAKQQEELDNRLDTFTEKYAEIIGD